MTKIADILQNIFLCLFVLLLPTQLGKHFFLPFSYINGIKIDYLSLVFYLTDIIVFLLCFFYIKVLISFTKKYWHYLIVMGILLLFNIIFSQYKLLSFYHVTKLVEVILMFIIFSSRNNHKIIFISFVVGAIFELILSTLQISQQGSLQGIFYFFGERYMSLQQAGIAKAAINGVEFLRPYGTFSHPNSLGGFYLLLYIFFLTSPLLKKYFWIKYIGIAVFSLLVFISFSKIVFFTYVLLNILYLFSKGSVSCLFCKISRAFVLVILGLLIFSIQHDPLSGEKRIDLIIHSFQIFFQHPIFGIGLGHYLYGESAFRQKYSYFLLQPVHNIFLLFLSQAGVLLSGFIGFVAYKIIKSHEQRISFGIIACALVIFITGMFDHYWLTLQQNFLLLGVVAGLLISPPDV